MSKVVHICVIVKSQLRIKNVINCIFCRCYFHIS